MTEGKLGRGRPPKPFFADGTPRNKPGSKPLTKLGQQLKVGARAFGREIAREFKRGPHVPLALPMEILKHNDGSNPDSLEDLHQQLEAARVKQKSLADDATVARKSQCDARKQGIISKNGSLFDAVR